MSLIKPKTISRIAAVQSLYCYYATNSGIKEIIEDLKNFYAIEFKNSDSELFELKLNRDYFDSITLAALENIEQIDGLIEENLAVGWSINKLHLTLLSILRVAVAELYYFLQTPYKVVISEFSDIAGNMLTPEEVGFVNSLLQKINDQKKPIQDDPFA
jgi:N utilization substance protein B